MCRYCSQPIVQTGRVGHPRVSYCSNPCRYLAKLEQQSRRDMPAGRWDRLVWFAEGERIMSPHDLAAALERHRGESPAP